MTRVLTIIFAVFLLGCMQSIKTLPWEEIHADTMFDLKPDELHSCPVPDSLDPIMRYEWDSTLFKQDTASHDRFIDPRFVLPYG